MLSLLNIALALTQEEITSCVTSKCDSLQGKENLDCRSRCAQVPFGGKETTDKNAACNAKCGSDQNCHNSCTADFITQQGGKFVSSQNNGINDKLVVGDNATSTNTTANNSGTSSTTPTNTGANNTSKGSITAISIVGVLMLSALQ